jgi:hypothetical protein
MTSISSELFRISKIEYLESLPTCDLAFWLIHGFTPERYRDSKDVVKHACKVMYEKLPHDMTAEFFDRLWGMYGLEPDHAPEIFKTNVVQFKGNS